MKSKVTEIKKEYMLKTFTGNRNDGLGADLTIVGFKKVVWLYEVRKQPGVARE